MAESRKKEPERDGSTCNVSSDKNVMLAINIKGIYHYEILAEIETKNIAGYPFFCQEKGYEPLERKSKVRNQVI